MVDMETAEVLREGGPERSCNTHAHTCAYTDPMYTRVYTDPHMHTHWMCRSPCAHTHIHTVSLSLSLQIRAYNNSPPLTLPSLSVWLWGSFLWASVSPLHTHTPPYKVWLMVSCWPTQPSAVMEVFCICLSNTEATSHIAREHLEGAAVTEGQRATI